MSAPTYKVLNPATGEVVEEFAAATDEQVEQALAAAQSAYESWQDVDINERAKIVSKVGTLFAERAAELGRIMTTEMGKPLSEAVGEAEFCQEIFEYFATEGPALAADQEIKSFSGGKAVVQKRPVGPLLGIMPWNFPLYQVARFAAPNLMLGNTIILKHAES
ncbi:MAG: aldehyde dehydrogenase family protein, partial [Glutamicibacter sp.]